MDYRILLFWGIVSLAAAPPAVGQTPLARQENVTAQILSPPQVTCAAGAIGTTAGIGDSL